MVQVAGEPTTDGSRAEPYWCQLDLVLVATVAAGTVLRLWGLGAQSLWYDEWSSSEATRGSLPDLFHYVANREGSPPTYFLVLWGWRRLFGDSELALRSLSALAGTATIPVVYAAVRELGLRRTVARIAALITAVHPMLVWYSQEARPYTVLSLLGAMSLLTFARVWNHPERRDLGIWASVAASAVAVHYFAVFLVLAEGAALLIGRRRSWRELAVAGLPSAVVLAALAPIIRAQDSRVGPRRWITDFTLLDRLRETRLASLVGPSPFDDRIWALLAGLVLVAVVLVVVRSSGDERRTAVLVAGIGSAAVVFPLLAVPLRLDAVVSRYLIAAVVPGVIVVAIGVAAPRTLGVGPAVLTTITVVSVACSVAVARDPDLQRPEWEAAADGFAAGSGPRVLVVNLHGVIASPLLHYADDARVLGEDEAVRVEEVDVLVAKPTTAPCNFLVGRACSLVFLGAPPPAPLADKLHLADSVDSDQFRVDRYRADGSIEVAKTDLVSPADLPDSLVLFIQE